MRARHRLVLCLEGADGDRGTNARRVADLVCKGMVAGEQGRPVQQSVQSVRCRGGSQLAWLSGAGSDAGLEQAVREGYEWLAETYADDAEPDEIFVFGCSRGAYAARLLVDLVGACGLLRRGAPLTFPDLWQGYCLLGRPHDQRAGTRRPLRQPRPFRPVHELLADPWAGGRSLAEPATAAERLLVVWSRRARIQFLGLFDTIGPRSDAPPELPADLVQSCYHALAIDEHRGWMRHVPVATALRGIDAGEQARLEQWRRVVHQRWFVGAHGNVCGGDQHSTLGLRPLHWVLQGARRARLAFEEMPARAVPRVREPGTLDGGAGQGLPWWTHLLRTKQHYRRIEPEGEVRVLRDAAAGRTTCSVLQSIHEQVDPSVVSYAVANRDYVPPNLLAHARGRGGSRMVAKLAGRDCPHGWLWDFAPSLGLLVVWAVLAGLGAQTVWEGLGLPGGWPWLAAPLACGFALADWGESRLGHAVAMAPESVVRSALGGVLFGVRAAGVALVPFGAAALLTNFLVVGWTGAPIDEPMVAGWFLPLAAGAGAAAAAVADRRAWAQVRTVAAAVVMAAIGLCCLGLASAAVAFWIALASGGVSPRAEPALLPAAAVSALAGPLLLLQVMLPVVAVAWRWAGAPLRRSRVGSLWRLQAGTPAALERRLDRWRERLQVRDDEQGRHEAAWRLANLVRAVLWRQVVGAIPLTSLVFAFAMWHAGAHCGWSWLGAERVGAPVWLWLGAGTAAAAWLEALLWLQQVRRYAAGEAPGKGGSRLAAIATALKWLAMGVGGAVAAGAAVASTWSLLQQGNHEGWRGVLALACWIPLLGVGVALAVRGWRARAAAAVLPPSAGVPPASAGPVAGEAGVGVATEPQKAG